VWEEEMTFVWGIVLIAIGLGMVFIARQRVDGTSILRVGEPWDTLYPALCLIPLAFGLAFIVTG
jgi:hypothetical protein